MHELFERPDDAPVWQAAAEGAVPDWTKFLSNYVAATDWPSSLFWDSMAAVFPDAPILLSTRSDEETWYASVVKTVLPATQQAEDSPWRDMACALFKKGVDIEDLLSPTKEQMIAGYRAHNARVRELALSDRSFEWQPEDGWGPICEALKLPVPATDFPHENTRKDFAERIGSGTPAPKT